MCGMSTISSTLFVARRNPKRSVSIKDALRFSMLFCLPSFIFGAVHSALS